jgi:8-oxo-dGTP pyrophosphatase MutT (NUDIX family)
MEKRIGLPPKPQTVMYCNNCGAKGHLFRSCNDPVLSCGIILVDTPSLPIKPPDTRLVMIRRKDSMSFAEFMRGKYDVNDKEYIGKLIGNMTMAEQSTIAYLPFDMTWRIAWGDDSSGNDYAQSQLKYNQLNLKELVAEFPSVYGEPEWGFPKGRRIRGESDVDCAIREFWEETNISRDAYVVLKNIRLEETFEGLNGITYRHVYFVGLLKHPEMVNLTQRFTPMQRREISAIAWKTFEECDYLVRPHHVQRKRMIEELRSVIDTFETI